MRAAFLVPSGAAGCPTCVTQGVPRVTQDVPSFLPTDTAPCQPNILCSVLYLPPLRDMVLLSDWGDWALLVVPNLQARVPGDTTSPGHLLTHLLHPAPKSCSCLFPGQNRANNEQSRAILSLLPAGSSLLTVQMQ